MKCNQREPVATLFSSGKLPTDILDASEQFSSSERTSDNNGKILVGDTIELKNANIATDEHTVQ